MNRVCSKCGIDMILDCEVYTRVSTTPNEGLGIKKKNDKGLFNYVHKAVKVAVCPKCGTIEYYIENPEELL